MREAQKRFWEVKEKIEKQIALYNDLICFDLGGDILLKKTMKFKRTKLYEEIWEKSLSAVAIKYGIPNQKLKEACKKANIPLPTLSYWGKLHSGIPVTKELLSPSTEEYIEVGFSVRETNDSQVEDTVKNEEQIQLYEHNNISVYEKDLTAKLEKSLIFLLEAEFSKVCKKCLEIKVDINNKRYHPAIVKHKTDYAIYLEKHPRDQYAGFIKDSYRRVPDDEPALYGKVSEKSLSRIYRILDALYIAIEDLGGKVNQDLSVVIRGEHVMFSFSEGQEKVKHVLTKEEQKKLEEYELAKRNRSFAFKPTFRQYDYIPNGRLTFIIGNGKYIRDTDKTVIESRLGDILCRLYVQSEVERIERLAREAEQRKREEEQRQREIKRKLYNEEVDKIAALKNEALNYEMACRIRAYVEAVSQRLDLTPENKAWIKWANDKADWYDPTMDVEDPILGRRNYNEPIDIKKNYY